MKVQPAPAPFRPITITLETQAEIDAWYTILNHISISDALGFNPEDRVALRPFVNMTNINELYAKLVRRKG